MQANYMTREMHKRLWELLSSDENRGRKGIAGDSSSVSECSYRGDGSDDLNGRNNSDYDGLSLPEFVVAVPLGFDLPKGKTITFSVIGLERTTGWLILRLTPVRPRDCSPAG